MPEQVFGGLYLNAPVPSSTTSLVYWETISAYLKFWSASAMNRDVETQAFLWKMLLYFVEEMPTEVLKSGWILEVTKKKKRNCQAWLLTSNSSENPGWRQRHAIPKSRLLPAVRFRPACSVTCCNLVTCYWGFHTSWATGAHLKSTPALELMSYLATACICLIKVIIPCSVAIKVWH